MSKGAAIQMTIMIDNEATEQAAQRLAELTGQTITRAVDQAIQEKLAQLEELKQQDWEARWKRVEALQAELAKLPVLDPRTPQEICDDLYDEDGLPK